MPSTYLTNGFTATVLETREIVHCPDPFDIRFRYEVQLSGGNDSEKAAAPVNSGSYSSDRSDRATSERAIGTAA